MTNEQKQRLLAFLTDAQGAPYYSGQIDGKWGPKSDAAQEKFLEDLGVDLRPATVEVAAPATVDSSTVMVFSLAADGAKQLTPNFKVREFACKDGSDPVLIHPMLPVWCQAVRDKFGYSFSPNSAYRTVSYNAKIGGAAKSQHCYGRAVDIPAKDGTTPQQLYDFFEEILGDTGGLGLYSWGVHVDPRPVKSRWKG